MSLVAILLVAASVVFHATWNVYLKEESSDAGFLVSFNVAAAILVVPLVLWTLPRIEIFVPVAPHLLASSVCNALYYLFLYYTYRRGDFSVGYPVSRSAPIFVVTIAGLLLGETTSAMGLAGIVLVVAGCFLIPFGSLKDFAREVRSGSFLSPALGFAFLTALATSGYSLFDKYGSLPPYRAAGTLGSLGYMALEWVLTGAMLYGIARVLLRQRGTLRPLVTHARKVWIAAFLMTFSYGFVMVAYQFANVSYVVGFRQLSVVLGVVLGALVLKERVTQGRAVGTAVIAIGLILIALA